MPKSIRYLLYGILVVVALLLSLAAYFAITFDPNDYKQQIIDLVKAKKDRVLTIDGDIKLSFWPKIGADLGKISLSEHQSTQEFAAVNSIKVALAVLPLLKKELVVDTIYIDGAQATIIKHKDGSTNFDDLLSKDKSESQAIKFDVQGVNITNSQLHYIDEGTEAKYNLGDFNMKAGHIALAEPIDLETDFTVSANAPVVSAKTKLKGIFTLDPDKKHYGVKKLDGHIKGDLLTGKNVDIAISGDVDAKPDTMVFLVDGLKLVASGNFDGAAQTLNLEAPAINIQNDSISSKKIQLSATQTKADTDLKVNMSLADMQGSAKAVQSSGITGNIAIQQGKRTINGQFSSPFKGNIEDLVFDIPQLIGQLHIKDINLPNGGIDGTFNLNTHADIKKEQASAQFKLAVAETNLNGDINVNGFKKQDVRFNLNADQLNLNQLLGQPKAKPETKPAAVAQASKPADLSGLSQMTLAGKIKIASILYDKYRVSGLSVNVTGNGDKVSLSQLNAKVDNSQIKGNLGISHFKNPLYSFDIDIDQLNLDQYITASKPAASNTKPAEADKALDLSALKALNADGSLRIGQLSYGKTKLSNVRVDLKADSGVVNVAPFAANLYQGSMNGSLKLDARATPNITFKQSMKNIAIGPLLVDAINNDMLSGTGTLNLDVNTQGNTVGNLKKSLAGSASLALTDGAIKGIDIAGSIRDIKNKVNFLKTKEADADQSKKTDFSELTASFDIKNGIAHNEDLAMKAPVLRLAKGDSRGDINIGSETINYTAKPTIVKSLKGQGGADLDDLSGIAVPVKISGSFAKPKYGLDYTALATGIAQSKLLDKVGGEKGAAVKELLNGNAPTDALKGLLNKNKADTSKSNATEPTAPAAEQPKSTEEKAGKKLKELLKF